MEGLYAFETASAMRAHFTRREYDFFRYNGKLRNISPENFSKRKDVMQWARLERRHKGELLQFLAANMIEDPLIWIGDLASVKAEKRFLEWKKMKESFTYYFRLQLTDLSKEDLEVKGGNHPNLLKLYMAGKIRPETIIALDMELGFLNKWEKEIDDTIIWPDIHKKLCAYRGFLDLDAAQIKKVVAESFDN